MTIVQKTKVASNCEKRILVLIYFIFKKIFNLPAIEYSFRKQKWLKNYEKYRMEYWTTSF